MQRYALHPTDAYAEDRREGIHKAIQYVYARKVEYAMVVDQEGVEIWRGKGTVRQVCTPEQLVNSIVVHNHPSGNAEMSWADLTSTIANNEYALLAVGKDEVSILERPSNGYWRRGNIPSEAMLNHAFKYGGVGPCARLLGATYRVLPLRAYLNKVSFVGTQGGIRDIRKA